MRTVYEKRERKRICDDALALYEKTIGTTVVADSGEENREASVVSDMQFEPSQEILIACADIGTEPASICPMCNCTCGGKRSSSTLAKREAPKIEFQRMMKIHDDDEDEYPSMEKLDELWEQSFHDLNEGGENSTDSDNQYTERKFIIYESMFLGLQVKVYDDTRQITASCMLS